MNRAHIEFVMRMLAIGLTSFTGCTVVAAQPAPDLMSPAGDTGFVRADECTLQFEDLWDCEAGRWRDAAQDTLYRAMIEVQEEIPDSEDEIERRINGMCSLDMLTWEIGDVVMSSGSRRRPVSCYIAQATLDQVERFRTGAKVKEVANVSQGACRNFYRANFFAGLLKAYRAGQTNPLRVACGEAFAASRVGIYRKGSPEAVVVRKMQLLAGDSCDFDCHLEIIGLYSRRYLQAQKGFWLAVFE